MKYFISFVLTLFLFTIPIQAQDFQKNIYFDFNKDGMELQGNVTVMGKFIFLGGAYLRLEYKDLKFNKIAYKEYRSSDAYSEITEAVNQYLKLPYIINSGGYHVQLKASADIPKEFVNTLSYSNTAFVSQVIKVYPVSDATLIKDADAYFKSVNSQNFSDNDIWVRSKINRLEVLDISGNITRDIKQKIDKGLEDYKKAQAIAENQQTNSNNSNTNEETNQSTASTSATALSNQADTNTSEDIAEVDEENNQENDKNENEANSDENTDEIKISRRARNTRILDDPYNTGVKQSEMKYRQQQANQIYNQSIANANASQKILNNWNSRWDNIANQYAQNYETYQNFSIKREQLTRIQANNIQGIQREYRRKLAEIDRTFESQLATDYRTINQAANSVKTGDYSDVGADIAGELMKMKAKKNAEKQKRQTRAKLQREKDAKIENLKRNIKNKARYERTKYLNAAAYALSKQEEDFFLKHYQYHDCAYQNPGAALYNNCGSLPPSNKPYVSSDTPSASEFYEIYLRKKRSSYSELRENADKYLELALQEDPNNAKYLFEKAKAKSTSVEESEVLVRKCLYLEPNNTKYENELKRIIKRKKATLGEEGKIVNGKKQGVWTEYWSDGSEKQKVNYINGKRDGEYLVFYDKDTKETKNKNDVVYFRREQWVNGVKQLQTFVYYKSGQLHMKGKLASAESDDLDGKASYFREDGSLAKIVHFNNGKQDGPLKEFYPSGELKYVMQWKNDSFISLKSYAKNGSELDSGTWTNGNGSVIEYNDDESIKKVRHFKEYKLIQMDNYKDNYSKLYSPDGNFLAYVWYYGKIKNPKTYAYYHNKKMIQQFDMAKDGSILNFAITRGRDNYISTFLRNNGARISVLSKHANGMPHKIKIEYNVSSNTYLNFNTNLTARKDGFQIKMKKEYWVLYSNEQGKVTGASVHKKKNGKLTYSGNF